MKLPAFSLTLLGALLAAGCSSSEQTTVGSQERGSTAQNQSTYVDQTNPEVDFKAFKTYSWASQVSDAKNSAYFLNDATYKNTIRDAVAHELDARGYVYQANDPDLLVNFRVFDQPTEIRDNSGYGDNYWTANEYRPSTTPTVVKLDKGSVVMQLVDRKKSEVVWQGYASGLSQGETMAKERTAVASAVNKVFAQYTYRADNQ